MTATTHTHDDLSWDLQDRLAKSLRVAKVSVQEMAEFLDLHRNTVGGYLAGRIEPDKRTLLLWAQYTKVDFDWLKGDDPPHGYGDGVSDKKRRRRGRPLISCSPKYEAA